jgi:hypothetical protein
LGDAASTTPATPAGDQTDSQETMEPANLKLPLPSQCP